MMPSQIWFVYRKAEEVIDELADSRTVMNATFSIVGVLTVVSLIVAIVAWHGRTPLWSYVLGSLSIVFLIDATPRPSSSPKSASARRC
jgi:asparagine N-glycosylation enzyme membrane subunit Stt3